MIEQLSQYSDDTIICINNWYPHKDDVVNKLDDGYEVCSCAVENVVFSENWIYLDGHGEYVTSNILGLN